MFGKFFLLPALRRGYMGDGAFVALVLSCGMACAAETSAARYRIDQPAQALTESLRAIARQTGASVIFDPVKVDGRRSRAVSGQLTAAEAVAQTLEGTDLVLAVMPDGSMVIRSGVVPGPSKSSPASSPSALPGSSPASSSLSGAPLSEARRRGDASPSAGELVAQEASSRGGASESPETTTSLSRVEITGSRLKRIDADGPTPVNVYTRADIDRSGQPTLERFLSGLNEVMSPGEGSQSATNGQGSVQLRGLPLGSTLVLINGRRVQAVGASSSRFFNLSMIPMAAVDRVEIVPVGSSAVYGGDALAGVINIILKKQIDGVVLDARVGSAPGLGDGSMSLGTGGGDAAGSFLLLGSYSKATPLTMTERAFFRDADYRRFGGVDSRARYCTPGTVSSASAANLPGLNATFAGIPAGTSGQRLAIGDFAASAGVPNLCSTVATGNGATLIHGTENFGLHAGVERPLGGSWSAFGEFTFSRDRLRAEQTGILLTNVLVPASNAYNPFGVPVRVNARLGLENGAETLQRDADFKRALVGLRGEVLAGWELEASASTTRDDGGQTTSNSTANVAARTAALAASSPGAALSPFTAGRAASDELLRSIWPDVVRDNNGRKDQASVFVRGAALTLPTGNVDVIAGAEAAHDRFYSLIRGGERVEGSRSNSAVYGEARVPLWRAPADAGPARDLAALTLAARRDSYSDFGGANTYQTGLEIRPTRTSLLRASAATSFKPPTLLQMNVENVSLTSEDYGLTDPQRANSPIAGGEVLRTTNSNLGPERGKAFSLGAVWEPEFSAGTRFAVTAWQVRIRGLIGLLLPQVALNNEALFPGFVTRAPAVGGVPGQVSRVIFAEVNFGALNTAGVDMEVAHAWKALGARWTTSASATRTRQYDVALTPGSPVTDRLGRRATDYWAPKWKGRIQAGVEQGAWGLSLTSRYLGAYRDVASSGRPLGNHWTHDLAASLDLKRLGLGIPYAKEARLSLAVANVAGREPDYVGAAPYYDVTQSDWRGRYASLRVSLTW